MKFRLEKSRSLSPQHLREHPVWAQYHSDDDIDNIVAEGYSRDDVIEGLEATGYSDDYVFPVLDYDSFSPYMCTIYRCQCILPNDMAVDGHIFVTSYAGINAISIFSENAYIPLNLSDPTITELEEQSLKERFSVDAIFPLRVQCSHGLKLDKFFNPYA